MVRSKFTPEQKILTVPESVRTDNGTQYAGNDFRKAVSVFGIEHEFVWKHTPEQNGPRGIIPQDSQKVMPVAA